MNLKSVIHGVAEAAGVPVSIVTLAPSDQDAQLTVPCFTLAKEHKKSPAEIALGLATKLADSDLIESASAAGPYVNIQLRSNVIIGLMQSADNPAPSSGQEVLVEYGDPNPFKAMHIGHLYTAVVGESIARMKEAVGLTVRRLNYGGDVGLHVARAMWGIANQLGYSDYGDPAIYQDLLAKGQEVDQAKWVSSCYVAGTAADVDGSAEHDQIVAYNKAVYQLHIDDDHESNFAKSYWICRQWCYDAFDDFFKSIGVNYHEEIPESKVAQIGVDIVQEHLGKVFEEDDGAIIFRGSDHGLHNRVFITQTGVPLYETKDLGLAIYKSAQYPQAIQSIIITAREQAEYFKVVYKSISLFNPSAAEITQHIHHGFLKLAGGKKMSSRKGDVLYAVDVIESTKEALSDGIDRDMNPEALETMNQAAYKFGLLKTSPREDIHYDLEVTTSTKGKSGPYLLYSYARAKSVLSKIKDDVNSQASDLQPDEVKIAWQVAIYPQVLARAELANDPSQVCTYLYDLAKSFSVFYENNRVIDDPREQPRAQIMDAYCRVLAAGLDVLAIKTVDRV